MRLFRSFREPDAESQAWMLVAALTDAVLALYDEPKPQESDLAANVADRLRELAERQRNGG